MCNSVRSWIGPDGECDPSSSSTSPPHFSHFCGNAVVAKFRHELPPSTAVRGFCTCLFFVVGGEGGVGAVVGGTADEGGFSTRPTRGSWPPPSASPTSAPPHRCSQLVVYLVFLAVPRSPTLSSKSLRRVSLPQCRPQCPSAPPATLIVQKYLIRTCDHGAKASRTSSTTPTRQCEQRWRPTSTSPLHSRFYCRHFLRWDLSGSEMRRRDTDEAANSQSS